MATEQMASATKIMPCAMVSAKQQTPAIMQMMKIRTPNTSGLRFAALNGWRHRTKSSTTKMNTRDTPGSTTSIAFLFSSYKCLPRTRPDFQDTAQRMEYKERLRNSTKSKLDESLQTAFQTESVAADTSERLYHQRKQLENVDKMLHETDQNLDRTEHTLKGMKSLWGGIGNYFKRAPEKKPYRGRESNGRQRGNARNKGMALERERAERKSDGGHSAKVSIGGTQAEDEEFNDKLDELHQSVQRMRMMAENMNRELDDQNQLIGGIDDKMERVNGRIDKQNYTMKRIR